MVLAKDLAEFLMTRPNDIVVMSCDSEGNAYSELHEELGEGRWNDNLKELQPEDWIDEIEGTDYISAIVLYPSM